MIIIHLNFYKKKADHCEMVNDDGEMFTVSEKHIPNGEKWADQADKNITMKMEFWWNVTEQAECPIARMKALVSVDLFYGTVFLK